jgi:hypothetical protein
VELILVPPEVPEEEAKLKLVAEVGSRLLVLFQGHMVHQPLAWSPNVAEHGHPRVVEDAPHPDLLNDFSSCSWKRKPTCVFFLEPCVLLLDKLFSIVLVNQQCTVHPD